MKFSIDEDCFLIYNSTEPGVSERNFQNLPPTFAAFPTKFYQRLPKKGKGGQRCDEQKYSYE